jgi:RNA polymerase sigma factor (sigma-70 family)
MERKGPKAYSTKEIGVPSPSFYKELEAQITFLKKLAARYRKDIDTEDLVSMTIADAVRSHKTFKKVDETSMPKWLSVVMRSTFLNYMRKKRVRNEVTTDFAIPALWQASDQNISNERRHYFETLAKAIEEADLSPIQREAIRLLYLEGHSKEDAAKLLKVAEGTAGSIASRARAKILEKLKEYGVEREDLFNN